MYDDKIEEIKKTLRELALIMLNLKRGANLEEYEFINFQTNLAECLYNAMSVYREISQKERVYIEMKESLHDFTTFIDDTLAVGLAVLKRLL